MMRHCQIKGPGGTIDVGSGHGLVVIAGPCVLEDLDLSRRIAQHLRDLCRRLGLGYVFKASFDKANRSSLGSARGPGLEDGLRQLSAIRQEFGVPVTTDLHEPGQAAILAEVVDVMQIPAFLSRQTDLLLAAGEAAAARGVCVNIKKGQFLSPVEMRGPVEKVRSTGCTSIMVTERGSSFGYHRLVNDFTGLGDLLSWGMEGGVGRSGEMGPGVCFDCTHSVQTPGTGETTGGHRARIPLLARCAAAAGVDAIFFECHPDPGRAPSDASNMLELGRVEGLLEVLARHAAITREADSGATH